MKGRGKKNEIAVGRNLRGFEVDARFFFCTLSPVSPLQKKIIISAFPPVGGLLRSWRGSCLAFSSCD